MARVKAQKGEDLSDFMVSKVSKLLNQDEPISKREACDLLKINYNTTRLAKIIDQYHERKRVEKQRRKEMRSKPFSDAEISRIITMYLQGASLEDMSSMTFRSVPRIKAVLEKVGVPKQNGKVDYFHPDLVPDELLREEYSVGDIVWSARYGAIAEVIKGFDHKDHGKCYKLWLFGKNCKFADQPWYELGHLDCLKEYNISVKQFTED